MVVWRSLPLIILVHTVSSLYVGLFIPFQMTSQTVSSPFLSDIMLRIIQRYDLVAIHGFSDSDAMRTLYGQLQRQSRLYEMIIAFPIDKPGHNYADVNVFIYKKNLMSISEPIRDQPSGALYSKVKLSSSGYEFVLMLMYSTATKAVEDAEGIPSAYDRSVVLTGIKDMLIVGSFGAGFPFMTKSEFDNLQLTKNDTFQWYVDYEDDTIVLPEFETAAQRFIGVENMNDILMRERLNIFNVTDYYGLSYEDTLKVTTFYPIEIEMKEPNHGEFGAREDL